MKTWVFIFLVMIGAASLQAQGTKDLNFMLCQSGPEFKLEMPNIFTPNRDYVNDHFIPKVDNEICLDKYYLGIYDRWGSLLYESTVYSVGWHGNNFYGEPYADGTYYYRMSYTVNDVKTGAQKIHSQNGFFQLVR